ncbi:BTB/POZ protein [Glomus cerebriforme]|uniref:BTB/POZ protein n=1 Tax=Glomus cerebriforme TaxID=658196 RepID=A0A397T162_9GLOM|nr:BTB/POZ protein [Glomus cerebriforme]
MAYNLWPELSKDLSSLLDENNDDYNDCNVIIKVGDNEKEFYAHSYILRSRSDYFRKALSKKWANCNENGKIILSKPNMKPKVFHTILEYVYSGSINFDELDPQITLEILVASDEFMLESLIDTIQTYMIDKQSEWLQLNMSVDFSQLEESALTYVLKRDDLELEEIEIWENDRTEWTNDDLLALKNKLQNCLSFIRFFQIPSEQYYKHVKIPFQVILPENLDNDIIKYRFNPQANLNTQILPPRITSFPFDSEIINFKDASRIAGWID